MSDPTEPRSGASRRRTRSRRRRIPARPFWGDAAKAAGPDHLITPVAHPTALIESLGTPPFPRADVAPHYFAAVYQRAAGMALALATAAGLVDTGDTGDTGDTRDAGEPGPAQVSS